MKEVGSGASQRQLRENWLDAARRREIEGFEEGRRGLEKVQLPDARGGHARRKVKPRHPARMVFVDLVNCINKEGNLKK